MKHALKIALSATAGLAVATAQPQQNIWAQTAKPKAAAKSTPTAKPAAAKPVAAKPAGSTPAAKPTTDKREKKIFAHYMGCWPAASGAMVWDFKNAKNLRHDAPGETERMGGHIRNWSLPHPDAKLSLYESCDLEIRRALHIGIDGFTIDAWAGGQDAKNALDMLFKVAEEKKYPFEITITPDPNALQGSNAVEAIKYLLDKHGKSPNLARRDGKPLIFGYQTIFQSMAYGDQAYIDNPALQGSWIWDKSEWRATPKGFEYMGKAMKTLEERVGQPLFIQYCMSAFDYGVGVTPEQKEQAAGIIGKYVGGVGSFTWLGMNQDKIGEAVKKSGAEWMYPIGFGQKENIPWESYGPAGLEWFHSGWQGVLASDTTLMQYVTWNDYGENSALAPALNTRYALFDLTNYYIAWWKKGKPPTPTRDKVYLSYHKYPPGSKLFPFVGKFTRPEVVLEVVTILTKPATIKLPGRKADGKPIEYSAPAGFFTKQFPNTPGEVKLELVRDKKVAMKLQSPEPITDKPFREDNGYVSWSSEEERHWKSDFGAKPMWTYSEYGDEDKDGLPNWFEMYWFGTWMDFSTQSVADPKADPDKDGKTNLQEHNEQTDPTLAPGEEANKWPLAYIKNRLRGPLVQAGSTEVPFNNNGFEKAGATPSEAEGWLMGHGAVRSDDKASEGKWSVKMTAEPGQGTTSSAMQGVAGNSGYSWNSDPLHPNAVRSGAVVGYAVDLALDKDGPPRLGYMRLAHDPYAGGHEMWGIPMITTSSAKFSRRFIAHRLGANIVGGGGMGGTWGHVPTGAAVKTAMYFDNFSPITIVRPQLKVSDTAPLQTDVAPDAAATLPAISITNAQTKTLPIQLKPEDAVTQLPTLLYGVASFQADDKRYEQNVAAPTDHVGAVLIGENANLFEFVSENIGANPQQLKLIGADKQPGLLGGETPESEEVVIRFKGAAAGEYSATLRIVTQAANTGTLSLAKPGEPPYNLFYVDIPVTVTVG